MNKVPLKRQSSEDVMWNAVLKEDRRSPIEQSINDAWNDKKMSKEEVKKLARQHIEEQKKPSDGMKKELDMFLKNTNSSNLSEQEKKKRSLDNTKKTKRYKASQNVSKRLYKKTKGGRRRRSRRKKKLRRKRRGGMYSPGMMQDWNGILDPQDVLKSYLINPEYLPKEMKPLADSYVNRLIDNSINLASFQNRINELDDARRNSPSIGAKKIAEMTREINRFTDIIKGIENDNKKIRKQLEYLSKESTKKVVNPGKPYRRFEGGKKRKTRKKCRKRYKRKTRRKRHRKSRR